MKSCRVLIVDDYVVVLRALRRVIAHAGHEVRMAEDAEAGFAMVEAELFDIVITDLDMGARDGIWLLERVRARQPDALRVLSSGSTSDVRLHLSSGLVQCLLAKPVEPEALRRVLRLR
jgi:CheY-like chemotaxis protein